MKQTFRFRAFITLMTAAAFVVTSVSGVALFVAPSGRIARDMGWALWTLSRGQWIMLHLAFSAVFLMAAVVHLFLNRRPIVNYLRIKSEALGQLRWEWLVVLLVSAVVVWGSLVPVVPFSALTEWRDTFHHPSSASEPSGQVPQRQQRRRQRQTPRTEQQQTQTMETHNDNTD